MTTVIGTAGRCKGVDVVHAVAIAACRTAESCALHPDPDWPVLQDALDERRIKNARVAWDDPEVARERFDLVVVCSTWDSVDRPSEYLSWVRAVATKTRVENEANVLAWNLDKSHLTELEGAGIPVVPTTWVPPGTEWTPPSWPFVVKPAISGGGRETARYHSGCDGSVGHIARLHAEGRTVMVQPYLQAVDDRGETKMVFIGGRFSHAIRVGPLLAPGVGVMERPWEMPVPVTVAAPSRAELDLARAVMSYTTTRFAVVPLYARVDVVADDRTNPVLLELELVDPALFLWANPGAAATLALAIEPRLRTGFE